MQLNRFQVLAVVIVCSGFLFGLGCGKKAATQAVSQVTLGMTYNEVVSFLGEPCFTDTEDSNGKAWITEDRKKGVYIEFNSNEQAERIVNFDANQFVVKEAPDRKTSKAAISKEHAVFNKRFLDLLK